MIIRVKRNKEIQGGTSSLRTCKMLPIMKSVLKIFNVTSRYLLILKSAMETTCEICSKLTRFSVVFTADFEQLNASWLIISNHGSFGECLINFNLYNLCRHKVTKFHLTY